MRYLICSSCNTLISCETRCCPSCQAQLGPGMVDRVTLCQHDGTPVRGDGRVCPTCGKWVRHGLAIQGRSWLIPGLVVWIASTAFLVTLHHHVSTTYQPVSCVIDDTSVSSSWRRNGGTSYSPELGYRIVNTDGVQIASGWGDLGLGASSDEDDTEQVVNAYQIGSAYPCWYSPLATPSAVFVPRNEAVSTVLETPVWFIGTGLWLVLTAWCVVKLLVRPRQLYKRGVATTGTIKEHFTQRDRNGDERVFSILTFQTQTDPALHCRWKVPNKERLGKRARVFYDQLNPVGNVVRGANYRRERMVQAGKWGTLLVVLLLALPALLTWLAFVC